MRQNSIKLLLLATFLFLASIATFAQNPLSKRITIEAQDTTLRDLLLKIEQTTNYTFAYNTAIVGNSQRCSISAVDKPIKDILNEVFGNSIDYKIINNHIVLTAKPQSKAKSTAIKLSGFVCDNSEEPVESAIVYVVEANTTAITDSYGTFELNLKPKSKTLSLNISHPYCSDTILYIETLSQSIEIKLTINNPELGIATKNADSSSINPISTIPYKTSIDSLKLVDLLVSDKSQYVSKNIDVYSPNSVQVAFLPFVGTNLLTRGIQTNNLSFNILAGYSKGLNGAEFGSFANIIQGNAIGAQFAGISNICGGNLQGVQISGIANFVLGNVSGVQFAGIINTTKGYVSGLQLAGILNMNFMNQPYDSTYSNQQIAGILNVDRQNVSKLQVAGIGNIANHNATLQISGYANLCNDTVKILQASSVLNYARFLKGMQVGLVNIADTSNGVQIGLVNFVRRGGFRAIELTSNETNRINVSLKTGGKHFYTMASAGVGNYFIIGGGFGVTTNPTRKFCANAETLASIIIHADSITGVNSNLQLGLCYNFNKHIGIVAGTSVNMFAPLINMEMKEEDDFSFKFDSNSSITRSIENQTVSGWLGWYFGFRITV